MMQFWSLRETEAQPYLDYETTAELQRALVIARAEERIPDTVIFLEHAPVVTRGRGLQWTGEARERAMPAPLLLAPGTKLVETARGGDLTWHGPGQLVIYPIVKLDGAGWGGNRDVAGFLRKFESAIISFLGRQELVGEMREGATGVWIGDHKVASLGIAVSKWVTYHGAALNVVNDLAPFRAFSPCGFSPEVMTSLAELQAERWGVDWRARSEEGLAREFGRASDAPRIQRVDAAQAWRIARGIDR